MRIDEFTKPEEARVPFDVVDDLAIFMRNDPMFYRRKMFPCIMQMKDAYGRQENLEPQKLLGPIVDQAMDQYCDKFKLGLRDKAMP